MHNLTTVISFEITRMLKKKSFWIIAFIFPTMIAAVFGTIYFAGKASDKAALETQNERFSITYTDESGAVDPTYASKFGASRTDDKAAAIKKVTDGSIDAYFYFPKSVASHKVEIYAKDVGLFENSKYGSVAESLLRDSVVSSVSPDTAAILQKQVVIDTATYRDGQRHDSFKELIAPGVFLLLFYVLIALFGNQMLNSTTEEKENRVIEMLLTTVKAKTLIIGKIIALVALGMIQVLVILIPIALLYLLVRDSLNLPGLQLSEIPLDPMRILWGFVIFILSFLLFTGMLVSIGSAAPTAKEASSFFGVVMVLIFGPLYAFQLFISSPHQPLVQALSFFPFTAPIPLLIRNAVGNISTGEILIAVAILGVTAAVSLWLAVRIFRYGALQYSRKLRLKEIFSRS